MSELLYQRIVDDIKEKVNNGAIKAGGRIPSVSMIRENYQVSHITALRALKELTMDGFITKLPGKGYYATPHPSARNGINIICCLLRDVSVLMHDHYFNEIIHGVQKEARTCRFSLNFPCLSGNIGREEVLIDEILKFIQMQNEQIKGFLIDERIDDQLAGEILKLAGKPAVIINRVSDLSINSVAPDIYDGINTLIKTLRRLGYNRFIYADSGVSTFSEKERYKSFLQVMGETETDSSYYRILKGCSLYQHKDLMPQLTGYLKELSARTAIITTDSNARSFCAHLMEAGYQIPEDVGISGFGGTEFASYTKPELTTLKVNTIEMGSVAVKILAEEINGTIREAPRAHLMKTNLIFGETI